jgi:hypothetical protein
MYKKFIFCLLIIALLATNVFADRNLFQGIGDNIEIGNTKLVVNYVAYTNQINTLSVNENSMFAIINFDVCITDKEESVWSSNDFCCEPCNYVIAKSNTIQPNKWYNVEVILVKDIGVMKKVIMMDPITGKTIDIELREVEKAVV